MKKFMLAASILGFSTIGQPVFAQSDNDSDDKKETEELVIRKKGEKDIKLTVEIDGDKVTINGKPMAEFKDDQITINKRKIIIRDGEDKVFFDFGGDGQSFNFNGNDFIKQWRDGKEETRGFLGVTTEKTDGGVKITEVTKGSAAEKAGLKKDDIISKIDDSEIDDPETLSEVIGDMKPKEEVKVYYKRNGKKNNVKATLGERKDKSKNRAYSFPMPPVPPTPPGEMPDMAAIDQLQAYGDMFDGDFNVQWRKKKLGLKIQDTEEGGNVKVIAVEDSSAAAIAGLKKDDLITEIDGKKIDNTDDAREQLQLSDDKSSYTIKAKRNGVEMNFVVKIPKKLKTANL